MKNLQNTLQLVVFALVSTLILSGCSSKYIQQVDPDTKTEFSITLTSPSQGIFFVENKNVTASEAELEIHTKLANSIYNQYGPATDKKFVGRTNARQLKFIVNEKAYLLEVSKLENRTAMVLFNGKRKPYIEYDTKKYKVILTQYFAAKIR
jgi:uncharacterized lipoprotein